MFEKIIPRQNGPSVWLSRDVKKVLVRVFGGLGRGLLGIAVGILVLTPFRYLMPLAVCIGAVIVGGVLVVIAEYFRDEDGT